VQSICGLPNFIIVRDCASISVIDLQYCTQSMINNDLPCNFYIYQMINKYDKLDHKLEIKAIEVRKKDSAIVNL
jgi:hypothetical protein